MIRVSYYYSNGLVSTRTYFDLGLAQLDIRRMHASAKNGELVKVEFT